MRWFMFNLGTRTSALLESCLDESAQCGQYFIIKQHQQVEPNSDGWTFAVSNLMDV